MNLKLKFNLVMVGAFATGLLVAGVFADRLSRELARQSVLSEAEVMMAALNATIHYTDDQVAPLLARAMKVQFLPQAIPFYAAQKSFDLLAKERPDYTLRQPAENPTNPADLPQPWEADIIHSFQAQPALTTLTSQRVTGGGTVISFAQPVKVGGECLSCHSTPQAAPPSMIDAYGSQNGFGWKLGAIVGAQIVSVPQSVALARARQSLSQIMLVLAAAFLIMLVALNVLLHLIIIGPVRRISRTADEVSLGNMTIAEFEPGSRDEIGLLAMSFNRMRRSLVAAFQMLEDKAG